ncbi:4-hydroxy-tetrahydrodipicolinate synthase [Pseudoalteromonas luteoviolacea]|uniref:4-hydroxy-tetrahydrodipicolinate synthase n=1 Tax=Pseudoalteromonas luteoviolacea TaxID=43657 RepID=A0A1C0TTP3_9GAMM|nr:4-hydroxy-tetrahydrodipicolinate synthase [Pseudoalteromonas luteoviolacea]MBQ4811213.1 4-hydroxy-tetrahydrodipicolinate synthase [Pseudoalteromonas luteoviolacea]OCQ22695.1 4-hydroxy-tetrahydrodipicolinate synthase [Pseudoalteromonas luteoviolacea]
MKVNWQGVYPAVTTQFNDDESINFETTKAMINSLVEEGVHGIIVLGTVGENCSLRAEEKRQVLEAAKEVVAGRVPVLSGVAETTTALAIEFVKDAQAIGIDGFMVLPGMVYRSTEREAIHHYQQVARATSLPIMIYNNPITYGVDVSIEGMGVLAQEDNIVSVKEATEDTRRISELFSAFGDRFVVFGGVDDIALESLMLGATGWISGLTNVFPRESVAIYKLAQQGRYEEARELWRWFLPLLRLDTIPTLVQCIKYAEQLAGRGSEKTRSPRLALTEEEKSYVSRLYDEALNNRIDLSKYNLD